MRARAPERGLTSESPLLGKRALILGVAAVVSLAALALALVLGAWAFEVRRLSLHEGRLRRLVEEKPTVSIASQGLANEGWTAVAVEAGDDTLKRVFGEDPPARVAEVRAKRQRWPTTRVFSNGDLVYVLYFGPDDKAADWSLVRR